MSKATDKPVRVQLSRRKGWRMPPNTVSVARPGKWGNPQKVGWLDQELTFRNLDLLPGKVFVSPDHAVHIFEMWMLGEDMSDFGTPPDPAELRGKNLACWCPLDQPCHADVLLELANSPGAPA